MIEEIGSKLRIMHDYARSRKDQVHRCVPPDRFLVNGVYNPVRVLENFVLSPFNYLSENANKTKFLNRVVHETINKIDREVKRLANKVDYKEQYCTLVHGDLNKSNLIMSPDGLKVIDWANCRWDIASCDLAQFIHLYSLDQEEQELLIGSYNVPWINEEVLKIHQLLLLGWEVIYLIVNDLDIKSEGLIYLRDLKHKIWSEKTLPL